MNYEDYQNATFDPEQYPVYRGKPKSDKERIAELEAQIEELKEYNKYLKRQRQGGIQKQYNKIGVIREQQGKIKQLESQIGKLINFILSKTECCDVCPMTDTCINSEGTCPYAGILAKGEEEVTREWLMQFISKEIKEK